MDEAKVLNGIGVLLVDFKRYDEALDYFGRALGLMTRIFGPDHPMVALALVNQAEALNGLHRYEDARAPAERALAIWRTVGSSSFYEAVGRTVLGEALVGAGRAEDAARELEQARALFGDTASPYAAEARFALARALWGAPARETRALGLAREARDGYQRLRNAPAEVASVDAWLRAHEPDRPAKRP
jgi:tetratricopeptide (TPR) repeat protein